MTTKNCLLAALLCVGALHAAPAVAQKANKAAPAATGQASNVAPDKAAAIRKLMAMTGSGQLGVQVMDQLISSFRTSMPKVPQSFWDDFMKEVSPEELTNLILPIYDRHLSLAEIKEIIRFYETPVGKKLVMVLPQLTTESMEAGKLWGAQVAGKVQKRLQEKKIQP